MTIYILDNDPKKIAEYLDDKSLDKMIKDIAQVLCNVHIIEIRKEQDWFEREGHTTTDILRAFESQHLPYKETIYLLRWSQWAIECVANYKYLVNLFNACLDELNYRNHYLEPVNKYHDIYLWARDNVPDLPIEEDLISYDGTPLPMEYMGEMTPFPLVMPKKYICKDKELLWAGGDKFTHPNNTIFDNTINSYRNYYINKYYISLKGEHRVSSFGEPYYEEGRSNYKWTRREKPEWLD